MSSYEQQTLTTAIKEAIKKSKSFIVCYTANGMRITNENIKPPYGQGFYKVTPDGDLWWYNHNHEKEEQVKHKLTPKGVVV